MGFNRNENYFQGSMAGGGSDTVIGDLSSESDHGPFAFRAGGLPYMTSAYIFFWGGVKKCTIFADKYTVGRPLGRDVFFYVKSSGYQ